MRLIRIRRLRELGVGDVAAVLAAEDVTENAILLGWSYGGLVICDYLAAHGTGVRWRVRFCRCDHQHRSR